MRKCERLKRRWKKINCFWRAVLFVNASVFPCINVPQVCTTNTHQATPTSTLKSLQSAGAFLPTKNVIGLTSKWFKLHYVWRWILFGSRTQLNGCKRWSTHDLVPCQRGILRLGYLLAKCSSSCVENYTSVSSARMRSRWLTLSTDISTPCVTA